MKIEITEENEREYFEIISNPGICDSDYRRSVLLRNLGRDASFYNELLYSFYLSTGDTLADDENTFKALISFIRERYDIGGNLLEVGGGPIPIASQYMRCEQLKLGRGNLTVYDNFFVKKEITDAKLIEEAFTELTDISKYDWCYAIRPCKSSEMLIKKFNQDKKEMLVVLCGCGVYSCPDITVKDIFNQHIRLAERTLPSDFELHVDYLSEFHDPSHSYPIIWTKKKTR